MMDWVASRLHKAGAAVWAIIFNLDEVDCLFELAMFAACLISEAAPAGRNDPTLNSPASDVATGLRPVLLRHAMRRNPYSPSH